jgi:hypothetical protein
MDKPRALPELVERMHEWCLDARSLLEWLAVHHSLDLRPELTILMNMESVVAALSDLGRWPREPDPTALLGALGEWCQNARYILDLQRVCAHADTFPLYRALDAIRAAVWGLARPDDRDWIKGTRADLNQALGVHRKYPDYLERAARGGRLELRRVGKLFEVRPTNPADHVEVAAKLEELQAGRKPK